MTIFDYAVLTIIGLSVFLSIMRGLVHEVLAILGWITAFLVAKTYATDLLPMLPDTIPTDALRMLAAFLVLFLGTLLITSFIAIVLSALLNKLGLGWFNRLLGVFFGFARGIIIVCILVFLAGLTQIPQDMRWRNAMFSAPAEALVLSFLPWLPESIAKHVHY